jgi:hypothetical protein
MGYRSDVAIKIYGTTEQMVAVKAYYDQSYECLSDESKKSVEWIIHKHGFDDNNFSLYVNNVKWYEEYNHIKFFINLYKKADHIGANVEFCRIGEDTEDCQVENYGDSNQYTMHIARTIDGF